MSTSLQIRVLELILKGIFFTLCDTPSIYTTFLKFVKKKKKKKPIIFFFSILMFYFF